MSDTSQERAFLVLLGASLVGLAYVMTPFLYTFAVAAVIAVICWPVHSGLTAALGNRPRASAGLLTLGVVLLGAVPLLWVVALALLEAFQGIEGLAEALASDRSTDWLNRVEEGYTAARETRVMGRWLPPGDEVRQAAHGILLDATRSVGGQLPGVLKALWRVSIDVVVFCIAVYGAFVRGPDMLDGVRKVAPLRDAYVLRLFQVFQQLATNIAVGMAGAGVVQGLVASLGFWLAGLESVAVLGLITGVTSVVPIVGSSVVWIPVAVALAIGGSPWAAVFVTVWSLALTASADNVVKPFLLRNQLPVSPVWMLLSLFGGLLTIGGQGLVFGPMVLVLFLTLYTLYVRDFVDIRNDPLTG